VSSANGLVWQPENYSKAVLTSTGLRYALLVVIQTTLQTVPCQQISETGKMNQHDRKCPRLAIVLTDGYADWECAFLNGIGSAYYGIETLNVSPNGDKIVSQGGLRTTPDESLASVKSDAFSALVICGGTVWETDNAPDMKLLASDFLNEGKHVAAICGGTLALANAGILDDKRHTSNASDFLTRNSNIYSGQSLYVDEVTAIEDQNVITAPGIAPAHFSAAVFRAAGIDEKTVSEFLGMLSAEHG
jgi:putative intracellular protease/amidase